LFNNDRVLILVFKGFVLPNQKTPKKQIHSFGRRCDPASRGTRAPSTPAAGGRQVGAGRGRERTGRPPTAAIRLLHILSKLSILAIEQNSNNCSELFGILALA